MQLYKNYYYLLRCVDELNEKLKNKKIFSAFTQEKEKLYLHIPQPDYPDYHLIFSTDSKFSIIYQKEIHHKAKKNVTEFFSEHLPDKILEFSIAHNDRIIKIAMQDSDLYFMIRGALTNIFLVDKQGTVQTFKKSKKLGNAEEIKNELISRNYINAIANYILDLGNIDAEQIDKQIPSISKDILIEFELRKYSLPELPVLINEILISPISVFYSNELREALFMPQTFKQIKMPSAAKSFDNYLSAASYFTAVLHKTSDYGSLIAALQKHVKKELEKAVEKLNNLKARIDNGSKEKLYHLYGNLLLTNLNKLNKGMEEIELEEYESGEKVKIKLDPKLSASENANAYFDKARSEKINFTKSVDLYNSTKKSLEQLQKYEETLNANPPVDKLEELKKFFKIHTGAMKEQQQKSPKFRHYIAAGKFHIYVGKDSKNNDLLTTKFAKQNDYWFHARGSAGSHVVLRVERAKEGVPKSIIRFAASIAAFYSKAKTSSLVPVSYTQKKFVRKRKDLEPGQVILSKEEVIMVKPEIPADCVATED